MARFIKFIVALLLLPTAILAFAQTVQILGTVLGDFSTALSFILGMASYAGIHYGCYNFSRVYVFSHEMTHALAALLCGYRIKDVSIGKESGYVKMTDCNAFVVLAPYFVPFYVILVAMTYLMTDLFVDVTSVRQVFLFFVGFFTSFHFVQTFKTLFEADQPDLKLAGGKVFSVVMITLANLAVLVLVLKALFPESVHLGVAVKNVLASTLNLWRILVNYIVEKVINTL